MKKCLLLLTVSALLFTISTPTYATFWNSGSNNNNWPQYDWPKNDWPQYDWPKNDWPQYDWPKNDWPKDEHECNRWCGCKDNPVPEPATAGLAFMGLGALAFATRRRK